MPTASDILAILDKIPLWQRIKLLPKRLDDVESRLAELESKLKHEPGHCPACGSTQFAVAPQPKSKQSPDHRRYACADCGYDEIRSLR